MQSRREFLQASGVAFLGASVLKAGEPEGILLPPIKGKVFAYCEDMRINDGIFIEHMEAPCYDDFARRMIEKYPTVFAIALYLTSKYSFPERTLTRQWQRELEGQWWCYSGDFEVPGWKWPGPPHPKVISERLNNTYRV